MRDFRIIGVYTYRSFAGELQDRAQGEIPAQAQVEEVKNEASLQTGRELFEKPQLALENVQPAASEV